jgi:hypothetical protein
VVLAILYNFAQDSETITNTGSGGSSGNGQANFSAWHATNGNGAPYPYYGPFSAGGDAIVIPNTSYNTAGTGAFVHSWEIAFWYSGPGVNGTVSKIYDKAWGAFSIYIQGGYIIFLRAGASAGSSVYWTSNRALATGKTYYIQVSVNIPASPQSCAANNVSIWVGETPSGGTPVAPTATSVAMTKNCSDSSWHNTDSGYDAAIGNCSAGCTSYNTNLDLIIYREFSSEAKNWSSYSDFAADSVRWNPSVATTISCTPTTLTPILGQVYTVSGTLQTTAGVKLAGKSLDVWYTTDEETWHAADGYCTTDANGNYSYEQTAIALEDEYVVFEGDTGHNSSASPIFKSRGQKMPTSITMSPSTTTPPVGTPFTLSGVLSAMGTGLNAASIRLWTGTSQSGPWTPSGGAIAATTDPSGEYTIDITAVAGVTWYGVSYDGDATHLTCSCSPTAIAITGASVSQTVNAISPPDMAIATLPLGTAGAWIALPAVVPAMEATAGANPTITIGFTVTTTVVGMEIDTVIVYCDVMHLYEFVFPAVATGNEFTARPLIVSQLSTHVNTEVVGDCVVETENYTSVQQSETATTTVVPAMEAEVCDAYGVIAYNKVLDFDVVVIDEADVATYVIDSEDLTGIVTDSIDIVGEVATE